MPPLESTPPVAVSEPPKAPESDGPKEWVRLPNARNRKPSPDASGVGDPDMAEPPRPSPKAKADAPLDPEAEVVLHTVRAGEDFASISRYYYNSTRFRRALWQANRKHVPSIDDLRPGTTIRVPMPEALDPTLIPPAGVEVAGDPDAPAPSKPRATAGRDGQARRTSKPDAGLVPMSDEPADRPTVVVRQGQTLRSIARDTLDDPHRDGEILELNRDLIEDPRGGSPRDCGSPCPTTPTPAAACAEARSRRPQRMVMGIGFAHAPRRGQLGDEHGGDIQCWGEVGGSAYLRRA